jgi:hypothetical protein
MTELKKYIDDLKKASDELKRKETRQETKPNQKAAGKMKAMAKKKMEEGACRKRRNRWKKT